MIALLWFLLFLGTTTEFSTEAPLTPQTDAAGLADAAPESDALQALALSDGTPPPPR